MAFLLIWYGMTLEAKQRNTRSPNFRQLWASVMPQIIGLYLCDLYLVHCFAVPRLAGSRLLVVLINKLQGTGMFINSLVDLVAASQGLLLISVWNVS